MARNRDEGRRWRRHLLEITGFEDYVKQLLIVLKLSVKLLLIELMQSETMILDMHPDEMKQIENQKVMIILTNIIVISNAA